VEPFQDDIMSRRLDELTHQMRLLTLSRRGALSRGQAHPQRSRTGL
jgi:hypothetical protein